MDVCYVDYSLCIQFISEPGQIAIEWIHAYPSKRHSIIPGMDDHILGKLSLWFKNDIIRHSCSSPARKIIGPLLWQIEPLIDQSPISAIDISEENANLTVIDLAQPTTILPGHANWMATLLRKAGLIDMYRPIFLIADKLSNIPLNMVQDRTFIPGRIWDHVA